MPIHHHSSVTFAYLICNPNFVVFNMYILAFLQKSYTERERKREEREEREERVREGPGEIKESDKSGDND